MPRTNDLKLVQYHSWLDRDVDGWFREAEKDYPNLPASNVIAVRRQLNDASEDVLLMMDTDKERSSDWEGVYFEVKGHLAKLNRMVVIVEGLEDEQQQAS